ncbi:MAG: AAA family ATPase [Woeseiaceae bacterium]|nr:AAA family ATPase [Woeseiaceae bacterium]
MDSQSHSDRIHKIVVLNPKGGSGKTTLATNLASFFATRGPAPTLADCDPGGYSLRWLEKRPDDRPKVYGVSAHEYCDRNDLRDTLRAWPGSNQLIVDLPAAVRSDRLFYQTYDADSILIPIVPSEIDIYSAAGFIADLLLVAQLDRRNRNVAIVANRTKHYTNSYRMLMRFLNSLDIPVIAEFRDCQSFVFAAANGIGICEMPRHKVRLDLMHLERVVKWLDGWRMRKLDASVSPGFEHIGDSALLTPAVGKHH